MQSLTFNVSTSSLSIELNMNTSLKRGHPLRLFRAFSLSLTWPSWDTPSFMLSDFGSSACPLWGLAANFSRGFSAPRILIFFPFTTPSVSCAVMSSKSVLLFSRSTCVLRVDFFYLADKTGTDQYTITQLIPYWGQEWQGHLDSGPDTSALHSPAYFGSIYQTCQLAPPLQIYSRNWTNWRFSTKYRIIIQWFSVSLTPRLLFVQDYFQRLS